MNLHIIFRDRRAQPRPRPPDPDREQVKRQLDDAERRVERLEIQAETVKRRRSS
jgi:hypothetical protein